jgi:hypothetical protein
VKTGTAVDGEIPEDCPLPKVVRRRGEATAPGDECMKNANYYNDMLAVAKRNGFENVTGAVRILYGRLRSCVKVGLVLGVSEGTIRRLIKTQGWPIAPRGGSISKRREYSERI